MKEYKSIKQIKRALFKETLRLMKRELKENELFYLSTANGELMFTQAERNLDIYCKSLMNSVVDDVVSEIKK